MTTTAFDDQFTSEPEPVRQPYGTGSILRRNVADLELALKQQTERAEAAEAELERLREQKPVAWDCGGSITANSGYAEWFSRKDHGAAVPLYTNPIPAPAVPDGDDFNGSTPHLIQCMEALVRLDADGVLVPHGIGRDASKLLSAAANRLRKQTAPIPEEWRKVMAELADDLAIEIDQNYPPESRVYPSEQRRYKGEMEIVNLARALLQSAEVTK